jgi:hypothetical protein
MLKQIRNQLVPQKKEQPEMSKLYYLLLKINPIDAFGKGDCVETDFDPRGISNYVYKYGKIETTVRQITPNTWRVWRKK